MHSLGAARDCARSTILRAEIVRIRAMTPEDWPVVRTIYEEGIATGNATFQACAPTWAEWDTGHIQECRLVVADGNRILGWAALSRVSSRRVYAGVAEVSIYVAAAARGRSLGRQLLEYLVQQSEQHGFWTLQAGIFPENTASIALHQGCDFRVVGTRERLGEMHGRWRDVWLLERRSSTIG